MGEWDRAEARLRHTGTTRTPLEAEAQGCSALLLLPAHSRAALAQPCAPGFTPTTALKAFPMGVQGLAVPEGDRPPRSEIVSLWTAQPVKQCMPI